VSARRAAAAGLVAALLAGGALAVCGCKSAPAMEPADAAADAELADGAAGNSDALCNGLTQLGAAVTPSCDPGAVPAPVGGAITDGTYLLTETHFHGDCSTDPLSETLVVSQGTVQSVATRADGREMRTSVKYLPGSNGTTLSATQTCPARIQTTLRYNATATTLTIYLSTVLATRVSTFTLQ